MQDLLLCTIPFDKLKTELSETVKKELQALIPAITLQNEKTEFITRKEAAALLNISLPTLNEWTKTGLLQGYRIASRVRYKRAEIETSLSAIKTTRRAA